MRLPLDYDGPVPPQMLLMEVPEGDYLVFEHGPFNFETENSAVEEAMEQAMREFDYSASGYRLNTYTGQSILLLPRLQPLLEIHPPSVEGVSVQ